MTNQRSEDDERFNTSTAQLARSALGRFKVQAEFIGFSDGLAQCRIECVSASGKPSHLACAVGDITQTDGGLMKTRGEVEAAICSGMNGFERTYMGRGPKDVSAHVIGDLIVVRLQGVLTAAEQQLVKSFPADKGRELLKQVRTQLIEMARPQMVAMITEITGQQVVSLHHDISTITGEEIVLFTLSDVPECRELKRK